VDKEKHDKYGKELLKQLLGGRWDSNTSQRSVDECGVRADLDGVIWSQKGEGVECAVEIEARVYKQIRGAMVDLALHNAPKKLMIIILAQPQLGTDKKTKRHLQYVWQSIAKDRGDFRVVCLKGTGEFPRYEEDKNILSSVLCDLQLL
jgi:hypothetical protein